MKMKWRNAKKVAPLNGELCVFYLGNYEYVVGRIYNVSDEKNQEYLIMQQQYIDMLRKGLEGQFEEVYWP